MICFYSLVGIPNTVNTLIATTSRKRPPPVRDHLAGNRFVSHSNKCACKHSRVRPLAEFLDDCDHFLNQKFDIFLPCVSASSKRPPSMITNDYKKTIARTSWSQSSDRFLKAPTKCADRLWQLIYKKDDCSAIYRPGEKVDCNIDAKFYVQVSSLLGNNLISLVWAYLLDFSRRRPALASDRCIVQQGWSLTRHLTIHIPASLVHIAN